MVDSVARHAKRMRDKALNRDDEEFEVLDLSDRNWIEKSLKDLSKASVAKQITVGGVSGWCSGYVFGKVGKAAALALGGSLLLLQVAHHQGYITVNWGKLEKNMRSAQRRLEQNTRGRIPIMVDQVRDFVAENLVLAGGFTGGFLLGLAS